MLNLGLDQLATLVALDDDGTFDAAARRLHVTASAISQRVRAAELATGQVLVQRTNPVAFTAAGATVLRYARQMQLLQRDAEHELRLDVAAGLPSIGIAVNADSLNTWFLGAIAPLSDGMVFDLHREDQENTTSLLRSGAVVAAVTSTAEPVQGCASLPLGVMRYRAVCSTPYAERWIGGRTLREALPDSPVVIFDRDDDLQDRFAESVGQRPLTAPRHYVPSSADFASAVRRGFGWGLLPESQCSDDIASGALRELAPDKPLDVPLYWQRWNLATPLLDAVSDAVLAAAREHLG